MQLISEKSLCIAVHLCCRKGRCKAVSMQFQGRFKADAIQIQCRCNADTNFAEVFAVCSSDAAFEFLSKGTQCAANAASIRLLRRNATLFDSSDALAKAIFK
jgi:hypothetical protein